jgi:ATP-dependent helicase HrpB
MLRPLPIDPLLPRVVEALQTGTRLVLRAAPGAGKTTRVPSALLDAGLAGDKQVVVLEPRRLAARAAAEYVARERHQPLGAEVGYRVRFEQRGGNATRLWFVTEGVLNRQLLRDPFLEDAGVVVLDEFHERHLQADVALAIVTELQETVRPDLKLVVMSATLETERIAAHLGNCPVLTSEGRSYAVDIEYAAAAGRPLAIQVVAAVQRALSNGSDGGDVLVFLPGAAEIRRAATALAELATHCDCDLVPLHGDLGLDAQRRAIERGPRRKIVLSTNVAETSITIEGVTTVIDSGLARQARFDSRHGINGLRVVPISQAAAAQRAGRAGRLGPGRCIRLGEAADYENRRMHETPEILRLDLSSTVLELRAWGARDPASVRWLDAPGPGMLARADQLLTLLGAFDPVSGGVTDTGRRMLDLPVAPRLARLLLEAERAGCPSDGALLAALAAERDICMEQRSFGDSGAGRWPAGPSDLLLRMQLFSEVEHNGFAASTCSRLGLDGRALRSVQRARDQLQRGLGRQHGPAADATLLRCILAGFPDRVVRRRHAGAARGTMVGGRGVLLAESSVVRDAELYVAVDVGTGERRGMVEATVRLASAVDPQWLRQLYPGALRSTTTLELDADRQRVVERRRTLYADLVLEETTNTRVDPLLAGDVLAEHAQRDPEGAAHPGPEVDAWLERLRFLQRWMPEVGLPDSPSVMLRDAVVALCAGRCSFAELRAADLLAALRGLLSHPQQATLEREAPARYVLPTGRTVSIIYEVDKPPVVAARIQELFGLRSTPRLAGGRVALVLQLLAPNQRPVQITDDLESFWARTYPEVRKLLRGRYPKHPWPEDPLTAMPTARSTRAAQRA